MTATISHTDSKKALRHAVLRVALPVPLSQCFDYLLPSSEESNIVMPGVRLEVPFGSRRLVGVLIETIEKSDYHETPLKRAYKLIDREPILSPTLLSLCAWVSAYYHAPVGEVIAVMLPTLLRQGGACAPESVRLYKLSESGRALKLSDLTRAPRQANIIALLKKHLNGISYADLKSENISQSSLKVLREKAYVVEIEQTLLPIKSDLQKPAQLMLTSEQQVALHSITQAENEFNVFLLNGVTGSGKTQVYLDAIARVLAQNKQALVLVPEIGLTPQTLKRFESYFDAKVVSFHSGLNDRERLNAWCFAKSGEASIVIGTRSSVFMPFKQLGLIVIDEEHDMSFKQQDGVRYHARDVGIKRAQMEGIPIILGSATPSLETYYNAMQDRFTHLQLRERAGTAVMPMFVLADLRNQKSLDGLSENLIKKIHAQLNAGNQVLLFLNRRGYSPVLMCRACGWVGDCTRCDAKLTFHRQKGLLQCHHCDKTLRVPDVCPGCSDTPLRPVGVGTQRLEEALQEEFKGIEILRVDRDSTRKKGSLNAMLNKIEKGQAQILLGTQMLAKGHHFPNVTLVGIVGVDDGLFSHDFRGVERLAQLVIQVAGRAGRADKPGEVVLQTHHPDHPLLQALLRCSYNAFADQLLQERRGAFFPPFGYLALLRADSQDEEKPLTFLQQLKESTLGLNLKDVRLLGPCPAAMPKKAGRYRAQLLLQSHDRKTLHAVLAPVLSVLNQLPLKKYVRWSLDVDPAESF